MTNTIATTEFNAPLGKIWQDLGFPCLAQAGAELKMSGLKEGEDYIETETEWLFCREGLKKFCLIAQTPIGEAARNWQESEPLALPSGSDAIEFDILQSGKIELEKFVVYVEAIGWKSRKRFSLIVRSKKFAERYPEYPQRGLLYNYHFHEMESDQPSCTGFVSIPANQIGCSEVYSFSELEEAGILQSTNEGQRWKVELGLLNTVKAYLSWYENDPSVLHLVGSARCVPVEDTEQQHQMIAEMRRFAGIPEGGWTFLTEGETHE